MKYKLLLLLTLLAFTTADTWQPFTLDNHLSVQFPLPPTELDLAKLGMADKLPAGAHIYMAHAANDLYQVMGPMPIQPGATVDNPQSRKLFYDGVVNGMVTDQGSTLLRRRPFPTAAGEGVAITSQSKPTASGKAPITFSLCFVAGGNSYAITVIHLNGDTVAGAAQRRRFFDSITVKP